jgi:capsid protein
MRRLTDAADDDDYDDDSTVFPWVWFSCMSHKQTIISTYKNLEQPIFETWHEETICAGHIRLHLHAKFAPRSNYAICQKLGSGLGID